MSLNINKYKFNSIIWKWLGPVFIYKYCRFKKLWLALRNKWSFYSFDINVIISNQDLLDGKNLEDVVGVGGRYQVTGKDLKTLQSSLGMDELKNLTLSFCNADQFWVEGWINDNVKLMIIFTFIIMKLSKYEKFYRLKLYIKYKFPIIKIGDLHTCVIMLCNKIRFHNYIINIYIYFCRYFFVIILYVAEADKLSITNFNFWMHFFVKIINAFIDDICKQHNQLVGDNVSI